MAKFLIDNALSPAVAHLLRQAGQDAIHVRDLGIQHADDLTILEAAALERRVIVSADSDFGMLLAVRSQSLPSFILFKEPGLVEAVDYASRILVFLPEIESALLAGCVASFRRGRLRIRNLPLAG